MASKHSYNPGKILARKLDKHSFSAREWRHLLAGLRPVLQDVTQGGPVRVLRTR
jgi:hypothetical protein